MTARISVHRGRGWRIAGRDEVLELLTAKALIETRYVCQAAL
jgi:hypothetical protein